jgi:hypothetical protein
MSNNSSSQRMITNTANQIGYIIYTNSSDRFSGFFSYTQQIIDRLFTLPTLKGPNQLTKAAIEETKNLNTCIRFDTIDDLFNDLGSSPAQR